VAAWVLLVTVGTADSARAETGFLELEGSRISYEVAGSGPAIVFLHDGQMDSRSWDAQWRFFSGTYRVIRYDRRGYGKSSPATAPYSDSDDLHALLTHLGATNVIPVGCSAGGRLAIDFALAHPSLVRRLVLVGAVVSGLGYSEHFDRRLAAGFRPLWERGDVGGVITNWMSDPWLIAPANHAARERFREILTANPHNLTHGGRYSRPPSRTALGRLGEIRVPTLIVTGESDIPDVQAHGGAIQAGIPNSQRTVVPGAGHFVHFELPDEFNRMVGRFLAGSGRPNDLVYYLPAMDGVIVRSNLVYKTVKGAPLEADLHLPPGTGTEKRLPAIVFVLGDADPDTLFHAKDWTFMQSYGRLAAASGFAGITFNHRSSMNFTRLPDVREDVDDLIRHVRTHSARLNIDADRLCVWFFSGSGVHLEPCFGTNASFVRCVVGYYPLLAPVAHASLTDELRRRFSGVEQLKRHAPRIPPLLIARAGRDSVELNQEIEDFRRQAAASGVTLAILEHPQGEHAFDIRNDDQTSRDIVHRTLQFIELHLSR